MTRKNSPVTDEPDDETVESITVKWIIIIIMTYLKQRVGTSASLKHKAHRITRVKETEVPKKTA